MRGDLLPVANSDQFPAGSKCFFIYPAVQPPGLVRTVRNVSRPNNSRNTNGKTQQSAIPHLLIGTKGAWVPLNEIFALGTAQHISRVWELQHQLGLNIESRTERRDGNIYGWYRYCGGLPTSPYSTSTAPADSEPETLSLCLDAVQQQNSDPEKARWRR